MRTESRLHSPGRPVDVQIAAIATRQHGVISRAQLLALGLSTQAIGRRIRAGRLHVVYRGVFAVGHKRLTRHGHWMAAVLAGGEAAVLSHRSAAALWQLRPNVNALDVTLPRKRRDHSGIVFHSSLLPSDEVTVQDGIRTTTVSRTLLDLASVAAPGEVERAMNEADYLRLDGDLSLPALLTRYPRRRGTAAIRALLAGDRSTGITKRELEERFAAFVAKCRLPHPELNADVELESGRWIQVDCLWRRKRVIVELDSREAHATRSRFDSDRERDRLLMLQGWRVVRITWRHLDRTPARLERDVRLILGDGGG
ncbi:MAG: type IV toxin-antitoxin system AbiEi family antitoxin domain-containing protein [Thermoleophilaceae bacterium]